MLFAHEMNFVSFERLETLPAGTKPRALHHRSPGREKAIVSQTNAGTVSEAALGKLLIDSGAHMGVSKRIDTIWN